MAGLKCNLVSLIITAEDDEPRIGRCITHAIAAGRHLARAAELIVSDASQDGTRARLTRLKNRLETEIALVSLRSDRRTGKGWALRTAIAASRGDLIILLDPGLHASPDQIRTLVARLDQVDLAYASAAIPGINPQHLSRTLICRLLTGLSLPGSLRTALAAGGPLLRRLAAATITDGSIWFSELLSLADHLGCSTAASKLPCVPGANNRWPDSLASNLRDAKRIISRLPR